MWWTDGDCNGEESVVFLSEKYYYPDSFDVSFQNCDGCSLERVEEGYSYYKITKSSSDDDGVVVIGDDVLSLTVTAKDGAQERREQDVGRAGARARRKFQACAEGGR